MVKLDVSLLRYLNRDDFRATQAIELGMRNHELVPRALAYSISGINNGSISKILMNLTQNKLLTYERGKRYDGYRLTYRGYDYLALNVLRTREVLTSVGNQIGVGKESDVYLGGNDEGKTFAVKFHRLGRTCFRKVSDKRDYQHKNANHKTASWIYLSRLAALREFAFMKLLYERDILPIPEPIDCNRHIIVMEHIDGMLLNHVSREDIPDREKIAKLYDTLMGMIIKLANEFGVVHGDFNEFNILLRNNDNLDPVMIDFPQMISVDHELAQQYFDRDVHCIVDFFVKRFAFESDTIPCFEELALSEERDCDLRNLADVLEDEEDLIKHFESKKSTKIENEVIETDKTTKVEDGNDILSKYFKKNPASPAKSDEKVEQKAEVVLEEGLYYGKMDEQSLKEAEDKIKSIESQLRNVSLSNIPEDGEVCPELISTEFVPNKNILDKGDSASVKSFGGISTASTFAPEEIKNRLLREKRKQLQRQQLKVNPKNIKGDDSAFRRKKKNDQALANEDLKSYKEDTFW